MARFYVVGGANVDVKCHISGAVILATSNPGRVETSVGGVGRNIAENLSLLGVKPKLITALGHDPHADLIRASCAGFDLDVLTTPEPTGTYTAILDAAGELVVAVADMQGMAKVSADFLQRSLAEIVAGDMLIADANLSAASLRHLADLAKAKQAHLVLEPVSVAKSERLLAILESKLPVFLMSPNLAQLAALTGGNPRGQADLEAACAKLHERNVKFVLVGLGAEGAFWSNGLRSGVVPSKVKHLVDATGAGDAALAAALWALSGGVSLRESAIVGQYAAALVAECGQSVFADLTPDLLLKAL